jgi:hypothetical protein
MNVIPVTVFEIKRAEFSVIVSEDNLTKRRDLYAQIQTQMRKEMLLRRNDDS